MPALSSEWEGAVDSVFSWGLHFDPMGWDGSILRVLLSNDGRGRTRLACLAGVSSATMSRWERGVQRPSSAALARLAKALDASPQVLVATRNEIHQAVRERQGSGLLKDVLLRGALSGDKAALRIIAVGQGIVPDEWRRPAAEARLPKSASSTPKRRNRWACNRCGRRLKRRFDKHTAECGFSVIPMPRSRGGRYARVRIEEHLGSAAPGGPRWVQGGRPQ